MKAYCSDCKNYTNHDVLQQEQKKWSNDYIMGEDIYQIIQCKGCNRISFRYEYIDNEVNEPIVDQYPQTNENKLSINTDIFLPRKIEIIYKETITAYNNRQNILCATGLRSIVEGICYERGITEGNLKSKIDKLFKLDFLTKSHSDILHHYRFLGNDAVHELEMPSVGELEIAIKIIEHTLENIYELNYKKECLEGMRMQRQNK